ncbi:MULTISPECIES: zinc-binding dehydrogenase [unclassified Streptomyces]|uniref:zinc-binding dehydrogenase n=1 Tax=unclassified Streptomyces TaxID=2593676 RepID=UPI003369F5C1
MRVVRVDEFGPPQVLHVEEADAPEAGPGQAVVEVEVAAAIYGDTIVRGGRYPFPLPYVPGLEVAGRVVSVHPASDQSLVGQRVVATTVGMTGGYAEQAVVAVGQMHPVPVELSLDEAIAVFQAGAVAGGILSAVRLSPDDSVLVTAAAGRIGSLLVQLAKERGARTVIGAAGGERKTAAAREFGADLAVDYTADGWVEQVKEATGGKGADIVLDAVGGTVGARALDAAADGGGRIGVYGFTSGEWTALDAFTLGRRGLTVIGALGIAFAKPAAEQHADVTEALKAAAAGRIGARIHATYPLEQAAEAHADLEERRTIGAVLLRP